MPDTSQTKTEQPTVRRREEARKQGQVALSTELSSGALLLASVLLLSFFAPQVGGKLVLLFRYHLSHFRPETWTPAYATDVAMVLARYALGVVGGMLLGVLVAGLAVSLGQIGFQISGEALQVKWSRLSPAHGLKRIFSLRAVVRAFLGMSKLVAVSVAVSWALHGRRPLVDARSLPAAVDSGWKTVIFAALVAAGVLTVLGLLDFAFQRWQHEQDLRMSRREVQEEHKQEEGDPHIKSRVRKLQREASKHQMLREVPQASVVLTNPTHLAVAIKYERGVMPAPRVIAKGEGVFAKRMARIAREHGIPVLERKPLTRALFATAEVGQEIPVVLYQAIAEILAYVYRLPGTH